MPPRQVPCVPEMEQAAAFAQKPSPHQPPILMAQPVQDTTAPPLELEELLLEELLELELLLEVVSCALVR